MSIPLERIDVEERVMLRAEELSQKRFSQSFDDLNPQQQMSVFTDAEVEVQEQLNEAAERAWDERHEQWADMEYMRKMNK